MKRKESKHLKFFTPLPPDLNNVAWYNFERHPDKIRWLRPDALSQLLFFADVKAGGKYLVVDGVGGMLTGAVLERMGGELFSSDDRERLGPLNSRCRFSASAGTYAPFQLDPVPCARHSTYYALGGNRRTLDSAYVYLLMQPRTWQTSSPEYTKLSASAIERGKSGPESKILCQPGSGSLTATLTRMCNRLSQCFNCLPLRALFCHSSTATISRRFFQCRCAQPTATGMPLSP